MNKNRYETFKKRLQKRTLDLAVNILMVKRGRLNDQFMKAYCEYGYSDKHVFELHGMIEGYTAAINNIINLRKELTDDNRESI